MAGRDCPNRTSLISYGCMYGQRMVWTIPVTLLAAVLLYILSFGPALAINYRLNADPKMPFYQPLWWAADHWKPLGLFLRWYGYELWYDRSLPYRH